MPGQSALKVRPGLPIAQVGTWQTSTGEWKCTPEQIADAVRASRDPAFRSPVVKIGHTDPRFTDGAINGDGTPAVGYLENLRASGDGRTLLADWVGIPAWLDDIVEAAYPSRSIEAYTGSVPGAYDNYAMVCVGLAILGVTAPAIESLGDLADLYGVPTDVDTYVDATPVAACALPAGEQMPRPLGQVVNASADMNELQSAFMKWAEDQPLLGRRCYIRDILTDSVIAMVWDDEDDNRMYQCTWTETNRAFTFGDPVRVRPTYEAIPNEQGGQQQAQAASAATRDHYDVHVASSQRARAAVLSARGRDVNAGHAHPSGVHVPISPAQAALLGVEPDADEATIEAALRALREKADAQPPAPEPQQQEEGGTTSTQQTPAPAADVEQVVNAAVAAAVDKATAPILASLTTATTELASIKAERVASEKKAVLDGAVSAGKITPAQRDEWAKQYDQAPSVVTSILASIAPGTAVPISATGHTGGEVTSGDAEADELIGAFEKMLGGTR